MQGETRSGPCFDKLKWSSISTLLYLITMVGLTSIWYFLEINESMDQKTGVLIDVVVASSIPMIPTIVPSTVVLSTASLPPSVAPPKTIITQVPGLPEDDTSVWWHPPSKEHARSANMANDMAWIYPSGQTKAEFVAKTYTKEELSPDCMGACCLGASSRQGSVARPSLTCQHGMDLMALFDTSKIKRELFGVSHMFRLFQVFDSVGGFSNGKKKVTAALPPQFLFMGDSVMDQIYQASLCDVRRVDGSDLSMNTQWPSHIPAIGGGFPAYVAFVLDAQVSFFDSPLPADGVLSHIRKYIPGPALSDVHTTLCNHVQVMILGYGLHFNPSNRNVTAVPLPNSIFWDLELDALFSKLKHCGNKTTLIWYGQNHQHFRYPEALERDETRLESRFFGLYTDRHRRSCGPTRKFPKQDPVELWRVMAMERHAIKHGFRIYKVDWNNPSAWESMPRGDNQDAPRLYILPSEEISAPFWRNHDVVDGRLTPEEKANRSFFEPMDCTHFCWAPNIVAPLWDAMFMALNHSLSRHRPELWGEAKKTLRPYRLKIGFERDLRFDKSHIGTKEEAQLASWSTFNVLEAFVKANRSVWWN